ncbi:MAG: hypothetical protein GF416_08510 [Candidatus Altiarchaeales archaeon]|nr:hypothetical protein [Candidatus Altiarchaeales archaeon]MBD3417157.1 hypothetical protein [Candidatus Altiarchaeales archaeon]
MDSGSSSKGEFYAALLQFLFLGFGLGYVYLKEYKKWRNYLIRIYGAGIVWLGLIAFSGYYSPFESEA